MVGMTKLRLIATVATVVVSVSVVAGPPRSNHPILGAWHVTLVRRVHLAWRAGYMVPMAAIAIQAVKPWVYRHISWLLRRVTKKSLQGRRRDCTNQRAAGLQRTSDTGRRCGDPLCAVWQWEQRFYDMCRGLYEFMLRGCAPCG